MSWFGENLSTYTSQLKDFTKQVLTEGTEEVNDIPGELKAAKATIVQLEEQLACYVKENSQLKHEIHDNVERCEVLEMQLIETNAGYRQQLTDAQDEINKLKTELHDKEHASSASGRITNESLNPVAFNDWASINDDAENVIIIDTPMDGYQSTYWEQRIEEERESHRLELFALQEAHTTSMDLLRHRLVEDTDRYQVRITELEQRLTDFNFDKTDRSVNLDDISSTYSTYNSNVSDFKTALNCVHDIEVHNQFEMIINNINSDVQLIINSNGELQSKVTELEIDLEDSLKEKEQCEQRIYFLETEKLSSDAPDDIELQQPSRTGDNILVSESESIDREEGVIYPGIERLARAGSSTESIADSSSQQELRYEDSFDIPLGLHKFAEFEEKNIGNIVPVSEISRYYDSHDIDSEQGHSEIGGASGAEEPDGVLNSGSGSISLSGDGSVHKLIDVEFKYKMVEHELEKVCNDPYIHNKNPELLSAIRHMFQTMEACEKTMESMEKRQYSLNKEIIHLRHELRNKNLECSFLEAQQNSWASSPLDGVKLPHHTTHLPKDQEPHPSPFPKDQDSCSTAEVLRELEDSVNAKVAEISFKDSEIKNLSLRLTELQEVNNELQLSSDSHCKFDIENQALLLEASSSRNLLLQNKCSELENEIEEFKQIKRNEFERLQTLHAAVSSQNKKLQDNICQLTDEVNHLRVDLQDKSDEIENLTSEINVLKMYPKDQDNITGPFSGLFSSADDDVKRETLLASFDAIAADNNELRREMASNYDDHSECSAVIDNLSCELESTRDSLIKKGNEIIVFKHEHDLLQKSYDDMKSAVNNKRTSAENGEASIKIEIGFQDIFGDIQMKINECLGEDSNETIADDCCQYIIDPRNFQKIEKVMIYFQNIIHKLCEDTADSKKALHDERMLLESIKKENIALQLSSEVDAENNNSLEVTKLQKQLFQVESQLSNNTIQLEDEIRKRLRLGEQLKCITENAQYSLKSPRNEQSVPDALGSESDTITLLNCVITKISNDLTNQTLENKRLQGIIDDHVNEIHLLVHGRDELAIQVSDLERCIEVYKSEVLALKTNIDNITFEKDEIETHLIELQENNKILNSEKTQMLESYREFQESTAALESKLQRITGEYSLLSSSVDTIKSERDHLEHCLHISKDELDKEIHEKMGIEEDLRLLQNSFDQMKQKMISKSQIPDGGDVIDLENIVKVVNDSQQISIANQLRKNDNSLLQCSLRDAPSPVAITKRDGETLDISGTDTTRKALDVCPSVDLKVPIEEEISIPNKSSSKARKVKEQMKGLAKKLKDLQSQKDALETLHQVQNNELEALREQNSELCESFETLTNDLNDIKNNRDQLLHDLEVMDRQHQEATNILLSSRSDLQREVEQLKSKLESQNCDKDKINSLQNKLKTVENELLLSEQQHMELNVSYGNLSVEHTSMLENVDDILTEKAQLEEANFDLKKLIASLQLDKEERTTNIVVCDTYSTPTAVDNNILVLQGESTIHDIKSNDLQECSKPNPINSQCNNAEPSLPVHCAHSDVETFTNLKVEIDSLRGELNITSNELISVTKLLKSSEESYKHLRGESDNFREKSELASTELVTVGEQLKVSEESRISLKNETDCLQDKLELASTELVTVGEQLKVSEESRISLKNETDCLQDKLELASSELVTVGEQLKVSEESRISLKNETDCLQDKLELASTELVTVGEQMKVSEESRISLKNETDCLQDKLELASTELVTVGEQLKVSEESRISLKNETDCLQDKLELASTELVTVGEQLKVSEESLVCLMNETKFTCIDLTTATERIKTLEEANKYLLDQTDSFNRKFEYVSVQLETVTQQLSISEESNKCMQDKLDSLQSSADVSEEVGAFPGRIKKTALATTLEDSVNAVEFQVAATMTDDASCYGYVVDSPAQCSNNTYHPPEYLEFTNNIQKDKLDLIADVEGNVGQPVAYSEVSEYDLLKVKYDEILLDNEDTKEFLTASLDTQKQLELVIKDTRESMELLKVECVHLRKENQQHYSEVTRLQKEVEMLHEFQQKSQEVVSLHDDRKAAALNSNTDVQYKDANISVVENNASNIDVKQLAIITELENEISILRGSSASVGKTSDITLDKRDPCNHCVEQKVLIQKQLDRIHELQNLVDNLSTNVLDTEIKISEANENVLDLTRQLHTAHVAIADMTKEDHSGVIDSLKCTLDEKQEYIGSLEFQVSSVNHNLISKECEIQLLQSNLNEFANIQHDNVMLLEKLTSLDSKLRKKEAESEEIIAFVEQLKTDKQTTDVEILSLKEHNADLEEKLYKLQDELTCKCNELSDLRVQLVDIKNDSMSKGIVLMNIQEEMNENKFTFETKLINLQNDMETKIKDNLDISLEVERLKSEIYAKDIQLQDGENSLQRVMEKNKLLQEELLLKNEEIDEVQIRFDEYRDKVIVEQSRNKTSVQDSEMFEKEVESANFELSCKNKENIDLRDLVATLREDITANKLCIQSLQVESENIKSQHSEAEATIYYLQNQLQEKSYQLENFSFETQQLKDYLNTERLENSALQTNITDVTTTVDELQTELSYKDKHINAFVCQIERLQNEIETKNNSFEELNKSKGNEKEEFERKLLEAKDAMKFKIIEVSQINSQLTEIKHEFDANCETINTFQNDISTIKSDSADAISKHLKEIDQLNTTIFDLETTLIDEHTIIQAVYNCEMQHLYIQDETLGEQSINSAISYKDMISKILDWSQAKTVLINKLNVELQSLKDQSEAQLMTPLAGEAEMYQGETGDNSQECDIYQQKIPTETGIQSLQFLESNNFDSSVSDEAINEKEQMLSILNERSRESNSLKSELQRIVSVCSAQESALLKTQEELNIMLNDNATLRAQLDGFSPDVSKETIGKLANIIKDKDLEIESHIEKNKTLLFVLQDSQPNSSNVIETLVNERDSYYNQAVSFHSQCEQFSVELNLKTSEVISLGEELSELKEFYNKFNNGASLETSNVAAEVKVEEEEVSQRDAGDNVTESDHKDDTINELNCQLSYYKSECLEFTQSIETLTGRIEELSLEISNRDKIVESLEAQMTSAQSAVNTGDILESLPIRNVGTVETREQGTEVDEVRKNEIEMELIRFQMLVDRYLSELDDLRRNKSELEYINIELEATVQSCKSEISRLQAEIEEKTEIEAKLESDLVDQNEIYSRLESAFNEQQETSSRYHQEIQSLSSRLEISYELAQKDAGNTGIIEEMRRDNEKLRQRLQSVSSGEDEMMKKYTEVVKHLEQAEQNFKSQEDKLSLESERLRGHLMDIEDTYTKEALGAEEREKNLRDRLIVAEEDARRSKLAVDQASANSSLYVEELSNELSTLRAERVATQHQLAIGHEQLETYAESLANLQLVLEQFQRDRESSIQSEVDRYGKYADEQKLEAESARRSLEERTRQLAASTEALEGAKRLAGELDNRERVIEGLREELEGTRRNLQLLEEQLHSMTDSSSEQVDRALVKNLLIAYFDCPTAKRPDALKVIVGILGFADSESEHILGTGGAGWLPQWATWGGKGGAPPLNRSFSELFVRFLERESTPQSRRNPSRLPLAAAVSEPTRQSRSAHALAFNPFLSASPSAMDFAPSIVASTQEPSELRTSTPFQTPVRQTPPTFEPDATAPLTPFQPDATAPLTPFYSDATAPLTPFYTPPSDPHTTATNGLPATSSPNDLSDVLPESEH